MSNPFLDIINNGLEHPVNKWIHYLPLYNKHFKKFRKLASKENPICILEIGVAYGGSLDLWNKYFDGHCLIYGVDINTICLVFKKNNIDVIIGDQADKTFLNELKNKLPFLDIIIDDGGHSMVQQLNTFDVLYSHVKPGGVYLCEDTHTSYWEHFGGGLRKADTFIEFSKNLVDSIHGYHHQIDPITLCCSGIHFYDSMVFIDKSEKLISPPYSTTWYPK